jgi:hypothetical protein
LIRSRLLAQRRENQSTASRMTASMAPGCSKRCVAFGTIASRAGQESFCRACLFRRRTGSSAPPAMRRVSSAGPQARRYRIRSSDRPLLLLSEDRSAGRQSRRQQGPALPCDSAFMGEQNDCAMAVRKNEIARKMVRGNGDGDGFVHGRPRLPSSKRRSSRQRIDVRQASARVCVLVWLLEDTRCKPLPLSMTGCWQL